MGEHFRLDGEHSQLSPLDIVMGEDFGIIDIPPKMRVAMLREVLRQQQKAGRAGGNSSHSSRSSTAGLRRKPQAMVKLIRKGGTKNLRGMSEQMNYLRKEGSVDLERSERYFGCVLDGEAETDMMRSWEVADDGSGKADKTSHFVVSFPENVDHKAAYLAGREWAEELFASGKYGDVFDYYTAFHTDRKHPHTHVVVNRRGIEHDQWLKVSQREPIDYQELRFVQVRVAARHGIEMEASQRVARGVQERPLTDVEVQRAKREGRQPQTPKHSAYSLLRTIASTAIFARQIEADAGLINEDHPKLGKLMMKTAKAIREGEELRTIGPQPPEDGATIKIEEINTMNQAIEAKRAQIMRNFDKIDQEIQSVTDGVDKVSLERKASRIKAQAAQFMPDNVDLAEYQKPSPDRAYEGVNASSEFAIAVKSAADAQVRKIADRNGLDAELFLARYDGSASVPKAIAERWREDEKQSLLRTSPKVQADAILDRTHSEIKDVYGSARRDLEAYEGRKAELLRGYENERETTPQNQDYDVNDRFVRTVKDTITTQQQHRLENGDIRALSDLSPDDDKQSELARRYLENEIENAEGTRKGQLEQALGKVARRDVLAAEQARQREASTRYRKDPGLNR